jgi:DcuC family C4-dicarboxylate transporter
VGVLIVFVVLFFVCWSLIKGFPAQAVLLFSGILMLMFASFMGFDFLEGITNDDNNISIIKVISIVSNQFSKSLGGVGLMIMSIGGFVAYSDHIGASNELVRRTLGGVKTLKLSPSLTCVIILPLMQLIFVCIPSAAGCACLFMVSVFPVLVGLGVSRASAVSVITGSTAFGMGPASAITASASSIANLPIVDYFIQYQIPTVVPLMLLMAISYYFVNRYFDRKDSLVSKNISNYETQESMSVPGYFALIPIIPIIILVSVYLLNEYLEINILLNTTMAMLISWIIALFAYYTKNKSISLLMESTKVFWTGMSNIFVTVVTLVVTAGVFAKGLISLGFIQAMIDGVQYLGLGSSLVLIIFTLLVFLSSMLMGSGNAAFFSFGPLIPDIATRFGVSSINMILPMNLAASLGRTVSPISGVVLATSSIADVPVAVIVKRNFIPIFIALIIMLTMQILFL